MQVHGRAFVLEGDLKEVGLGFANAAVSCFHRPWAASVEGAVVVEIAAEMAEES